MLVPAERTERHVGKAGPPGSHGAAAGPADRRLSAVPTSAGRPSAAIAVSIIVAVAVAVAACRAQVSPTPAATAAASPTSTAGISPAPGSSSPTSPGGPDSEIALAMATELEMARAAGEWPHAWALLSDDTRAQVGSLADFAAAELAYNDAGGRVFSIQPPTQDPDVIANLVSPAIVREIQAGRGFLIFVDHPNVRGASAGSEGLFIAPLVSGDWAIWIVH